MSAVRSVVRFVSIAPQALRGAADATEEDQGVNVNRRATRLNGGNA